MGFAKQASWRIVVGLVALFGCTSDRLYVEVPSHAGAGSALIAVVVDDRIGQVLATSMPTEKFAVHLYNVTLEDPIELHLVLLPGPLTRYRLEQGRVPFTEHGHPIPEPPEARFYVTQVDRDEADAWTEVEQLPSSLSDYQLPTPDGWDEPCPRAFGFHVDLLPQQDMPRALVGGSELVWIIAESGKIYSIDADGQIAFEFEEPGAICGFSEGSQLWLGTEEGELVKHGSAQTERFRVPTNLGSIRDIDGVGGDLFVVADRSAWRFDGAEWFSLWTGSAGLAGKGRSIARTAFGEAFFTMGTQTFYRYTTDTGTTTTYRLPVAFAAAVAHHPTLGTRVATGAPPKIYRLEGDELIRDTVVGDVLDLDVGDLLDIHSTEDGFIYVGESTTGTTSGYFGWNSYLGWLGARKACGAPVEPISPGQVARVGPIYIFLNPHGPEVLQVRPGR